ARDITVPMRRFDRLPGAVRAIDERGRARVAITRTPIGPYEGTGRRRLHIERRRRKAGIETRISAHRFATKVHTLLFNGAVEGNANEFGARPVGAAMNLCSAASPDHQGIRWSIHVSTVRIRIQLWEQDMPNFVSKNGSFSTD